MVIEVIVTLKNHDIKCRKDTYAFVTELYEIAMISLMQVVFFVSLESLQFHLRFSIFSPCINDI